MDIKTKAEEAGRILNSSVMIEAFSNIQEFWTRQWENSLDEDTKTREIAYNRIKAIHELKRELLKFKNAKYFIKE